MRMSQFTYFALYSSTTTAQEMAERLSLAPDETNVRGSRQADPPRPIAHTWKLVCHEPGLTVDDQIEHVMNRLRPHQARIIELVRDLKLADPDQGGAKLNVVRYFNDEDGEEEELSPPDASLQKFGGQHQLLGFALEPEWMRFLVAVDACIDFDEYG
ncbi:DUF4279 domain-containing protein [Crossiella sp. CA198]|uniref:DUF4279 domain-containing protein n=1 Tax=Crossiella sp. CA198 TaxID=3455607 RepID=UPI003F8D5997